MKKMAKIIMGLVVTGTMVSAELYVTESHGTAPAPCMDGLQTVHFSNGASYTGEFSGCNPITTPNAVLRSDDGGVIQGLFEAVGNDSVRYDDGIHTIEIRVQLVPVRGW